MLPVSEKGHVFTIHFPPHLSEVVMSLRLDHNLWSRSSAHIHQALHSGVSILEHSGNDVGMNNGDANNSAGAADVSKSLPSDATN